MENATKALLISAGVLFAIVIVSMMVYAYTQLTAYYGEQQQSTTVEQLAEFNSQYEAYNRDDVTGFELVSLINKVINYNASNAVVSGEGFNFDNTEKSFEPMYIKFTLKDSLYNGLKDKNNNVIKLFEQKTYDSEGTSTEGLLKKRNARLEEIFDEMRDLENEYGASVLSKLVSNKDNLTLYGGNGNKDLKQVLGKVMKVPGFDGVGEANYYSQEGTEKILKYEQYIEFKRAEFMCQKADGTKPGVEYNQKGTGRITKLEFVQK